MYEEGVLPFLVSCRMHEYAHHGALPPLPHRYEEGVLPFLVSLVPSYEDAWVARGRQVRSSDVFVWSVAVGAWDLASLLWRRMATPVGLIGL